jgi:hypothetical protein
MKYFASVILILLIGLVFYPFSSNGSHDKSDSSLNSGNPEFHISTLYSSTQSHGPKIWAVEIEETEEEEKSIISSADSFVSTSSLFAFVCTCILGCLANLIRVRFHAFSPETHRQHSVPLFVEVCNYRI